MTIVEAPSPNRNERPCPVDMLVLHYTGMQSCEAAVERLRDPESKVSSHYVVDEDGTVYRLVPEELRAFHAGVSYWRGRRALNDPSIGIEIVNPGHEWGYRPFPAAQTDAVRNLCLGILARHAIPPENVVGHSDIAPNRKQDPGELFDWRGLAAAGIGIWPEQDPTPAGELKAALQRIGYEGDDADSLRAFQRRWLPEHLSAAPDAATTARACTVAGRFSAWAEQAR